MLNQVKIKTHDSESRGQEETAIIRETKKYATTESYLQGNPLSNLIVIVIVIIRIEA